MSNKLKKALDGAKALISKPSLINHILEDNQLWKTKLADNHPDFFKKLPQIHLKSLIPSETIDLELYSFLDGGSMATDLGLLKSLAQSFTNCRYFEIGTWRGESTANVASVATFCKTLNLSTEQMNELGLSQEYIKHHDFYSQPISHIEHVKGSSLDFDYQKESPYDLVFVDGDHHYDFVKSDTQNVLKYLLHDQSIVVWHDCSISPMEPRFEVIMAILDSLSEDQKNRFYLVANTLCGVLLPQPAKESHSAHSYHLPTQNFKLQISLEDLKPNE